MKPDLSMTLNQFQSTVQTDPKLITNICAFKQMLRVKVITFFANLMPSVNSVTNYHELDRNLINYL